MRTRRRVIIVAAAAASIAGLAAVASAAGLPASGTRSLAAAASDTSPALAAPTKVAFAIGPIPNPTVLNPTILVMGVPHGSRAGAKIQVRSVPAHATPPSEDIWVGQPNTNGSFTLHISYNTNLCLNVPGGNYRNGTPLDVEKCGGTTNQQFLLTQDPFALSSPIAGQNLTVDAIRPYRAAGECLTVSGGLSTQHRVMEGACSSAASQSWIPVYETHHAAASRTVLPY